MKHVEALDGLRAIAVLIVMVSHAGLGHIVPGGFGVTIFFFLSGYLITTLMRLEIAKTGRLSFAGFYLRRTVRIIPPMLICISVTVALGATGWMIGGDNAATLLTLFSDGTHPTEQGQRVLADVYRPRMDALVRDWR